MYHIIIETTDKHGNKKKIRKEKESEPTAEELEVWEAEYVDRYSYPENIRAVVVNVFHTY